MIRSNSYKYSKYRQKLKMAPRNAIYAKKEEYYRNMIGGLIKIPITCARDEYTIKKDVVKGLSKDFWTNYAKGITLEKGWLLDGTFDFPETTLAKKVLEKISKKHSAYGQSLVIIDYDNLKIQNGYNENFFMIIIGSLLIKEFAVIIVSCDDKQHGQTKKK